MKKHLVGYSCVILLTFVVTWTMCNRTITDIYAHTIKEELILFSESESDKGKRLIGGFVLARVFALTERGQNFENLNVLGGNALCMLSSEHNIDKMIEGANRNDAFYVDLVRHAALYCNVSNEALRKAFKRK